MCPDLVSGKHRSAEQMELPTTNAKPGGNVQLKSQQKMGTNPKLRGLGHAAKIPKGTHGQDLHPGETEPKYLEARWGPPFSAVWSQRRGARKTAQGLKLHQLQPYKSTGVGSTS